MQLKNKIYNYKITLEYNGENYFGWQKQKNNLTIQGEVEKVLSILLNEKINIIGSGRTDKGVHAIAQVANFKTQKKISLYKFQNGLNSLLNDDIYCKKIKLVKSDFNSRFDAKKRYYLYKIGFKKSVFDIKYFWTLNKKIEISDLNKYANEIKKIVNFESICKKNEDLKNYNCEIYESKWTNGENGKIYFHIKANRFLYGMVRALVGLMVNVAQKKISFQEYKNILNGVAKPKINYFAPPHGLYLKEIKY